MCQCASPVGTVKAAGTGDGEVGEEGDALWLSEDRVEVLARVVPQGQRSERAELDHDGISQGSAADHCTRSR